MAAQSSDKPRKQAVGHSAGGGASLLGRKQKQEVVDRLVPYISLYSRRSSSSSSSVATAAKSDRTSILKWFSSLSIHHRVSYLTIVDRSFAGLLLQMISKLRSLGHCTFIILPDLPDSADLPALCHRTSRGLLARIAHSRESERLIRDSLRLFSSKEGDTVRDSSILSADCIDTVTFTEDLVTDVDRFVQIMDTVTDGGFLMSDWAEMRADFVEFAWFKAQGYSTMEAFVANRMEEVLRSAWLSCCTGKKRGIKLKDKASLVGVAVNLYGRKKGCVNWWEKLDVIVKRKFLQMFFGKTAKFLAGDILRGADMRLDTEMWRCNKGSEKSLGYNLDALFDSSGNIAEFRSHVALSSYSGGAAPLLSHIKNLVVLQGIVALTLASSHGDYDKERLFFSSVDSVDTICDKILRKLREVIMVVSLEATKLELLNDRVLNAPPGKTREKTVVSSRRKKGKNHGLKKPDANSKEHVGVATVKTLEDIEPGQGFMDISDCSAAADALNELHVGQVEPADEFVVQRVPSAGRKNRKEQKKKKHSDRKLAASNGIQSWTPTRGVDMPSLKSSSLLFDHSTIGCFEREKGDAGCVDKQEFNSLSSSIIGSLEEDNSSRVEVRHFIDSADASVISYVESGPTGSRTNDGTDMALKKDCGSNMVNSSKTPSQLSEEKHDSSATSLGSCGDSENQICGVHMLNLCQEREENEDGVIQINEQENTSIDYVDAVLSGCPSYEWPSLAPLRFTSSNWQHHPSATDRLNLEVGHNRFKHFQRSSIQQLPQVRNPQIDGGQGKVLLQSLPLSSDWPTVVHQASGLTSPLTGIYDPGFIARQPCASPQGFGSPGANVFAVSGGEESKIVDLSDELDELDGNWISEEEFEVRTISCLDYSQYFGGGVMYWNPSDYRETGFSRPPSLSSDDSSWAWREAEMNRTIDDMVAFNSYSANGLTSPSTSFSSYIEAPGKGHHGHGYVKSVTEVSGKLPKIRSTGLESTEESGVEADAKSLDSLPYPLLRPIIVPSKSRDRSRAEFKHNHELRSPRIHPSIREQPRIKRPPSPVVLCVPHSPYPPPPALVGDARKQKGFATVRSGSSSPRNWGVKGWFHDGNNFGEASVRMDVAEMVRPSWGGKKSSSHQLVQPPCEALLQDKLLAISHLSHDQEHPDVRFPLQPPELLNCPARMASLPLMQNLLHDEIDYFCKQVASENSIRRPYINWAVKRVTRSLQVLWPRSRTSIFGSYATGLSLPSSDVDLVVCLPPVRNLEPIKEAGILEGRNGIKETCVQHAARYLANQEWVRADSLKTVENTAIPIIVLVVEVPINIMSVPTPQATRSRIQLSGQGGNSQNHIGDSDSFLHSDNNNDGVDAKSIRLDISFKSPSHSGLQTAELVKQLTEQFPASIPLALVLKQFLSDRSLGQSYSGGLSSYCLVLLIIRFLQHEHHHGKLKKNLGSIFMDFLYFFGNVFDPRRMRISIQGSGLYVNRERGHSIDPIYIDDPLFPSNNVGKNCFRVHQCIKAFADAYSTLENEITCLTDHEDNSRRPLYRLLSKIKPSLCGSQGMQR